jgi:hemolysin-activating ACP:hemolysin acyltransferase
MSLHVLEEAHITDATEQRQANEPTPSGVAGESAEVNGQLAPEMLETISTIRTRIHSIFGQVVLALTAVPRYRHQSVADLTHLVLEPLIRDRVAIASAKPKDERMPPGALVGIAIWASVSDEVDAKIQDQIKAGVFPIRLKPEDWTSGDTTWLLDVIAPTQQLATAVLKNFRQVAKTDQIRIHPLVARMVDPDLLKQKEAEQPGAEIKSEE